eukprot:13525747-Alexandrium_andersonii.AAC.1
MTSMRACTLAGGLEPPNLLCKNHRAARAAPASSRCPRLPESAHAFSVPPSEARAHLPGCCA